MKKILALIILIFLTGGCSLLEKSGSEAPEEKKAAKIRIGWQIPWATEGQLTQILKNTDLLKNNNLEGDFKGFSYGGPLNEAALAGEVDVLFTADQPAATLLAKNPNWTIIGRLMYNRVSLYVPVKSSIKEIKDLKGKTVAMPFGAAAQRMALKAEEEAGLDAVNDVNNINLGIYEQSDLVRDSEAEKWGSIDAMAGFDPTPAIFEDKGLVRNLHVGRVVSVIMMSNKFIEENPEAPKNFLLAFRDAYDYYRQNINQANEWFVQEAKLDISPKALEISASVEPNLFIKTKDEIRLDFNDDDYAIMQEAADFLFKQKMIAKEIEMKNFINMDYLK
jgi:ABC-type nitrate/sulfonate/bicarbonate transport system substrate-binding protein